MNRCVNKLKVVGFSAVVESKSVLQTDRNTSLVGILQLTGRIEMRCS